MIKNAAAVTKLPLQGILGASVPEDAVDLITQLLVFNPHKRLKADEALDHDYVSKFHDLDQEIVMPANVVIPLNDDIRLSVDDYRNKLYELMSVHHTHSKPCPKSSITRPKLFAPEVCSRVSKNAEKYIRSHGVLKDDKTQVMSHSESKIYQRNPSHWIQSAQLNKSDSKVPSGRTKPVVLDKVNPLKAGGDCKPHMRSSTEVPKRRITPPKPNLYQSFNSYNKTHGIITQSALMQLRASGLR